MILAPGDHRVLDELFEHRFLQSGQLSRLTGRSSQVIRRRLRRLSEQEFVMPLERRPAEQAAYSLGPEGFFFIAKRLGVDVAELPFSRRISAKKTQSPFWRHELRVTDCLISFGLAAKQAESPANIHRVIREWEMQRPRAKQHHEKFLLSERLEEDGRVHFHRPDACLLLSANHGPVDALVAAFIELDRGTESVSRRLRQKLEAYRLYNSRRLFDLQFQAVGMRVLFVLDCPTMRRADSLQAELRRYETHADPLARQLPSIVRIARLEDLEKNPLRAPVWRAGTRPEPRALIRSRRPTIGPLPAQQS